MCQQVCEFCETTVEGESVTEVKEQGKSHLESNHYADLADVFADKYSGKDCQSGCGYTYSADDEAAGFECPNCGHDHFDAFAGEYLFWRLEL